MNRSVNPNRFLTADESAAVDAAVAEAERVTTGEIKVVVVRHCWDDIRRKAAAVFKKFRLRETADHNAVLILLVTANRQFVIYGDQGIHEKAGQSLWDEVCEIMKEHFAADRFGEGLCRGIRLIGEKLAAFFPADGANPDEISNEITYDE